MIEQRAILLLKFLNLMLQIANGGGGRLGVKRPACLHTQQHGGRAASTGGAVDKNNGISFNGTLAASAPPIVTIGNGSSPAGGYLPLSLFGIPPVSGVDDDTITNFNVPAFLYGGEVYTRVGVSSNGYVVVGGGSGPDNSINNQNFPNPNRPNNTLALFWTDLNPGAAGAMPATRDCATETHYGAPAGFKKHTIV